MNGLLHHPGLTLRLYVRNRMALFYNYLFPVIFFAAFLVLYRYEQPRLILHMGELLTVSILGGACFGLPTAMVGERERGVWRRYRLAPISSSGLVASTLIARYITVLVAGLIQLALGMAVGGWVPEHPFDLWVAFTLVTFAFLGLGLVIATMADTVPAVQALGQCVFLPMLIIGGVAVKLTTLPEWALHVSAFFPGRYAVETMQECVKGDGLGTMGFNLFALLLIGFAGCLAGSKLFRWDAQQRFLSSGNKAWLGVAVAAWVVIGVGAEVRREIAPRSERRIAALPTPAVPAAVTNAQVSAPTNVVSVVTPSPPAPTTNAPARNWRTYTTNDYAAFDFESLPPDNGTVAPLAGENDELSPVFKEWMDSIKEELETWPAAKIDDPVQRVRNLLFVAGAADAGQAPIERFLPAVVLARMRQDFNDTELAQILCHIAKTPEEGSAAVLGDLERFGQDSPPAEMEARLRTYFYSLKFIRWLVGW